ncbi:MFS transporter [Novosphingobium sediminicola]|uniref:ACS family D-galactonate transporter-like MFS transporter n=1 Tax=Novosphingobium sediminicola TaxID=563162 RepID=A0A7W6CS06_9SPHN|nr:MFS transporter [Novosphingobium sediminicola]MBB3956707.1 ACS family D-galactonate transporter-like MFS transporter [Novosphingobium sediminicola]
MKPTTKRLTVLALISTATLINYLDRSVMGVAKPELVKELHITPEVMGLIFSAFSWTYALAQIPGGYVLDRLGTRLTYALSLGLWSAMTALHGLATGVAGLVSARLALGLAEAPCFPANSRVLSTWFPQNERAKATGVYTVGEYIGLGLLIPVLGWMLAHYGWRSLFFVVGALGIAFAFLFHRLYREPQDSDANQAEIDLIAAGGGFSGGTAPIAFSWTNVRRLVTTRQIAGASIGQFCSNSTLVFFLTWFPSYLAEERGMTFIKSGWLVSLPYIAAAAGVMLGGVFSDWLIRATGSPTIGRKVPIIAGLLLCASMVSANYMDSNNAVIAVMSLAFFGQGLAGLGWTLLSDVAPKEMMGLTAGLFNFFTNLAGIITPLVVGFAVGATGSFYGALAYIGALGIIGTLAYLIVLGPVERVKID